MVNSSPIRTVSLVMPFAILMASMDTWYLAEMDERVSPALTLYFVVTAVGPAVGVGGAGVVGRMVTPGVTTRGVRVAVGCALNPNPARREGTSSRTKSTPHDTRISKIKPAITIQGETGSRVVSPKWAGTRCTIRSMRQGSVRPGRDGGGVWRSGVIAKLTSLEGMRQSAAVLH